MVVRMIHSSVFLTLPLLSALAVTACEADGGNPSDAAAFADSDVAVTDAAPDTAADPDVAPDTTVADTAPDVAPETETVADVAPDTTPSVGTITYEYGGVAAATDNCDYVGFRPGDPTEAVFGTTMLCRTGIGGLPSIGLSFPVDTANGTTVTCNVAPFKTALAFGSPDSSVYSSVTGRCSITVSQHGAGAGDALVGTFSATLNKIAGSGPDSVEITNGAFDLTRMN